MEAWSGQYCSNVTDLDATHEPISFVLDPDGYQIELVTLPGDRPK